jgi:hypothetical protein
LEVKGFSFQEKIKYVSLELLWAGTLKNRIRIAKRVSGKVLGTHNT